MSTTRLPARWTIGVAVVGAALACALYAWGSRLSALVSWPLQAFLIDTVYLPAAATAAELWRGNLLRLHVASGLQWAVVSSIVMIASRVHPPRAVATYATFWVLGLFVPVALALWVASPLLRSQLLIWWCGWSVFFTVVLLGRYRLGERKRTA